MDYKSILLLFAMIKESIIRVHLWWKLPVVLIMVYNYRQRGYLMQNNLFEAYPAGSHSNKSNCQDPVIGLLHFGCMYNYKCTPMPHLLETKGMTAQKCVRYCADQNYPFAGYDGCLKCFCGNTYLSYLKSNSRGYCRPKSRSYCANNMEGCSRVFVDVYRTMFCTERMREGRSHDGTCNDLKSPAMGSRFYRFSRNVPPEKTREDEHLLNPNPREISQRLLKRKEFIPVKQLNLLAAAWIQFMLHDWFDHGAQDRRNRITVPLEGHDPLYSHHNSAMRVPRTKANNCKEDPKKPATYQNDVTHWWDGSQLYGSDLVTSKKVRSFVHGKLALDEDGLLKLDPTTGLDVTGFNKNWWVGLSIMHNLFTREHNVICDMLRTHYPDWSDEKLYDKARLINTAVMIKIHTIEWTPAILNDTALRIGVQVNWGLSPGAEVLSWLRARNISTDIGITPLVGNKKNMRGVNLSLTEEFVSVYRMHPLLPDHLRVRDIKSRAYTGHQYSLPKYSFKHAREIVEEHGFADLLYTFGVEYPGALTLFNYPEALMNLKLPSHQMGGETVDLGTIDVLRDRERGIPRFNEFRRLLNLKPVASFEELTPNTAHVAALKDLYCNKIENLDLLIGCLAEEPRPDGYGFGETAFNLFLMMASRRLETDRFLTDDFTDEMYTPEGMQWVRDADMTTLLLRNYPEVEQLPEILKDVKNAFFPWV